jgi:hypothetical protein
MSRQRRIRIVLLATLAGGAAALFLLREPRPDVPVSFLGAGARDSNRVMFLLSNVSPKLVYYRVLTLAETNGVLMPTVWLMREDRELEAQSAVNFEMLPGSAKRWKIRVSYFDANSTPVAFETRTRLALSAYQHHWERLSAWLDPTQRVRVAYGPEMRGDRPAPSPPP